MKKFIPYGCQLIDKADIQSVLKVLKSPFLTQGPEVRKFEQAICKVTGAKYCAAVSSGTAALHLAVAALEIESGMEGITSSVTFLASANCLSYNGLKPVLADIEPKTYCLQSEQVAAKITSRTKVIIPVDFAGHPAAMPQIYRLAKKKKLFVIEDACHAIGSRYEDGSKIGSCRFADMTTFSFHPVKTITTGEGGAITTNNRLFYRKLVALRNHGIVKQANFEPWYYEMRYLGFNYRLTDLQAALGSSQLKKLDRFVKRRREIVSLYNQAFEGIGGLTIPYERSGVYSAWHLYVLLVDFEKFGTSRSKLMKELKNKGIGTQVHYIPLYRQPYFKKHFAYKPSDFPNAEKYYSQALSLPLYPAMSDGEVKYVIKNLLKVLTPEVSRRRNTTSGVGDGWHE